MNVQGNSCLRCRGFGAQLHYLIKPMKKVPGSQGHPIGYTPVNASSTVMAAPDDAYAKYQFFRVTFPAEFVAHVETNRADKINAFNDA